MAGVPKYRILFSGVGKRDDEIREAIEADILYINVESEAELGRVEMIARELGAKARISIRVNPNIDPKTHPYISTGLHDNKFGVEIVAAKRMYIQARNSDNLDPVGIHFHIGSQLTELEPIYEAAVIVADLLRSLQAIDIELKFFDIGGGLGVRYDNETTIEPYDYAQAILSALKGIDVTIICEPGRFLTANAGYFVTKVLYEKKNGAKRFVMVDGAMNDLIRPSLYKAYHRIEALDKEGDTTPADVVGPVCESGDFLAKNYPLPAMEHNDILIVHSAGAYGFGMGSNYNTRGRSAEIAVEAGKERLIRRRETYDDVIALERDYL
jgi:diaminopimelate decarboxylase